MTAARVALVHDWLVAERGGEVVLRHLLELWPQADIFTLIHDPRGFPLEPGTRVVTSRLGSLPSWARRRFRGALPLFPWLAEALPVRDYDLVVSSSFCVAHGVQASGAHLAYVHSPARYVYDQLDAYLPGWAYKQRFLRAGARHALASFRLWDREAAQRPHRVVANSHHVRDRIRRVWSREATVVYPPVPVEDLLAATDPTQPRRGFVVAGALVPYKKVDVAILAANRLRIPLTVLGEGPERKRLERAAGSTVRFLGRVDRATWVKVLATSEALLFPGREDFGLVPVEALAAGCPVVSPRWGGALESLTDASGQSVGAVWAQECSVEAFIEAIRTVRQTPWSEREGQEAMVAQAKRFSPAIFRNQLATIAAELLGEAGRDGVEPASDGNADDTTVVGAHASGGDRVQLAARRGFC